MSEEATSSTDSKKVDIKATESPSTCEEHDTNNLNATSRSNYVTDSVNVGTKLSNHTDLKINNENNLDLCSDGDEWENEVNVIVEDDSPLSLGLHDSEVISNQNAKGEESKKKASTDYYIVSNENTAEPLQSSETIENVASLDTYRDSIIEATDDSDSSDSESSSTVSEDDDDLEDDNSDNNSIGGKNRSDAKKLLKSILSKGELTLEELPPIEDLNISVDENKCKEIGTISTIVDTQVVIQSLPNTPALDLDTVLFLDRGQRALGKIFDVLGNIHGPFYAVRFNSPDHIKEKNITKDQKVYFVPESEYTAYVDTSELLKQKGSDASWLNNNEPPVSCLDYSDDEGEARAKRPIAVVGSKRDSSQSDNDLFVKKMNQRNLELTAKRKKEDEAKQKRIPLARRMVSNAKNSIEVANSNSPAYSHYADSYKLKGNRSFSNADQATAATRLVNFHHNAGSSPMSKFDPVSRFLVGGYSSPSSYAFPPQHFLCSSPRQLPNVVPNAQNYLTMYSRPSIQTTSAMQPPPPPPPRFSSYTAGNIPMPPNFSTQPGLHPLSPSLHGPIPPQFSNFNPLSAPPMPSSLPQPYFTCADTSTVPQPTFIPLNVNPGISAAAFHQFVLPPPPPPPSTPSIQHHSHPRDVTLPRQDRRNPQTPHSNSSYYPHSPYNS